jgi:UDP-galactopyranose mutase
VSLHRPIVVFSHLRWDFVYQRPQQILSRLAAHCRVLYVEEPIDGRDDADGWELTRPAPNVTVARPRLADLPRRTPEELAVTTAAMLRRLLRSEEMIYPIAWLYTPMALPLLEAVNPALVVYDCMDELSLFLGAPPELLRLEAALLERADLVFTGGVSLYEAKRKRHPRVYCFPSSVDVRHFAQAKAGTRGVREPADQAGLPRPRLGFFGVIDERLDLEVLDAVAASHPRWQIVMVGPTVKIDPATLPKRPNIHYLGQRPYEQLPAYLSGWDVCLLPFARNDATRFISPTKTLEYMAAERPIVSTPIRDVVNTYGDIVYLAGTPPAFVQACERALAAPASDRKARVAAARTALAMTSWDATVSRMGELIEASGVGSRARHRADRTVSPQALPQRVPTLVVGAGPTGLSAAYHLGADAMLVEQEPRVGGWCRSLVDNGFTFDFAGHIMFTHDPYVHQLYRLLLGDNVHWQDREAWIYSKETYTRYPFQGALYGLPPAVIKECVVGAIEARIGAPVSKKDTSASPAAEYAGPERREMFEPLLSGKGERPTEPITRLSYGGPDRRRCIVTGPARNFKEFIYKVWGAGIARHFAIPYNQKLWAVPLEEMETSWLGGRVPLPDLEEMIEGALSPVAKPMGPNARFGYPLKGGFQALMDGFLPHLKGELRLNTRVTRVSPKHHMATFADGTSVRYEHLVSTMPLPRLVALAGDEAPSSIQAAARALRHVSVRCVNIGVGRPNITDKHWIYYPEETVFHRIFVQGNASPHCNPPGGFGFTCEITYSPSKPLPCEGDDLIRRCIADAVAVGFIREDDPIWAANQVDLPVAYVVYDHGRAENVERIRAWLAEHDIVLAGRYSEWEYYNSDHAFIAGRKAAQQVRGEEAGSDQAPAAGSTAGVSVERARAG